MKVRPILRSGGLMLIGEAPGQIEAAKGLPFMGASGQLLDYMLSLAGTSRGYVSITNVFDEQPPQNNLDFWGIPRKEAQAIFKSINDSPEFLTPIEGSKLTVHPERSVPALRRLKEEIARVNPTCIVALGNTALRAICGVGGIGKLRGALHTGLLYPTKVIPTYHPAAILRQYENLPIAVMDIRKALHESKSPETRQFPRKIHIIESLDDLHTAAGVLMQADLITFDVETRARQITCIGLSGSKEETFVLPFWSRRAEGWNYWPSVEAEIQAVRWLQRIMESDIPKVAHNGIYDIQYLLLYGIAVRNYLHDTMLMHHSLFPSLPKGLDFLGSVYCNERAWKRMRPRKKDVSGKKEE